MKSGKFKVGDKVRSRYAAPWYGTILELEKRKDTTPLATVRAFLDRNGRPLRKPITKVLDSAWLELIKE